MGFLYILCEGERDELFLDLLAERATGRTFQRPTDFRLRRGANWKTALATARLLLNGVKHWPDPQDIGVILAVDNDRAPGHPGAGPPPPRAFHPRDTAKLPRHAALVTMAHAALGSRREDWPVEVALAVPVEMIESWALCLHEPHRPTLPLFAKANQFTAQEYYGPKVPPQLKDLCDAEAGALGVSVDEYFWKAAEQNLEAAGAASPSLTMFLDELRGWRVFVG